MLSRGAIGIPVYPPQYATRWTAVLSSAHHHFPCVADSDSEALPADEASDSSVRINERTKQTKPVMTRISETLPSRGMRATNVANTVRYIAISAPPRCISSADCISQLLVVALAPVMGVTNGFRGTDSTASVRLLAEARVHKRPVSTPDRNDRRTQIKSIRTFIMVFHNVFLSPPIPNRRQARRA